MMLTIDADDDWCPPTLTPDADCRILLAWWIMLVANQRTRRSIPSNVRRSVSLGEPLPGFPVTISATASLELPSFTTNELYEEEPV